MQENGKRRHSTPIEYPTIEIPDLGAYVIRFDLGALYTLERDFNLPEIRVIQELRAWLPRDMEVDGVKVRRVGSATLFAVFDILAACIADQVDVSPRRLAQLFNPDDVKEIIVKLWAAYSKTPWPKAEAPKSAAATDPEPTPSEEAQTSSES